MYTHEQLVSALITDYIFDDLCFYRVLTFTLKALIKNACLSIPDSIIEKLHNT